MNLTQILLITIFYKLSFVLPQVCDKESCNEEPFQNVYKEDDNHLIHKITEALDAYEPIPSSNNCSCYIPVIRSDLKPFKDGITKEMIEGVRDRGTKYQIINHKLLRDKDCMFPARCSGIEYFIKPLLSKLPNMEMIINCRDWPQINKNWGMPKSPVFSFSKTPDYLDIMYPAWSFWEGGPAISIYPTGLGKWDEHRQSLSKAGTHKYSWDLKKDIAFFRGSRTSSERDPIVLLSRDWPELVDAQYTKNQAWKSSADTLNAEPAKEISLQEHCQYKYLFNYRGVAASFRFKHLFLCKSLVFHVGDEWKEFFYDSLKPLVHYVPVSSTATKEDLMKMIIFFKKHDDLAEKIAENGFQHIWDNLRIKDVKCYWKKLLLRYGKLLKYEVELDKSLIPIY